MTKGAATNKHRQFQFNFANWRSPTTIIPVTWSAARAKSNRGERPSLATEKLVFQLGELWAANATTVFHNLRLSQSLSKPSPLPLSFKGFTQYKHRSRKGREADFGCTAWITYGTRWTSLSMLSALAVMAPEGWPIPPYAVPP